VPESLLLDPTRPEFDSADEARDRYLRYLRTRLEAPRAFAAEAERARDALLAEAPKPMSARR
jgi:hypothetical protein